MRRSALVLSLGLIGAGAVGCKSTQQKLQESIQQAFEQDSNAGTVLCGYQVIGLSGIRVTGVTNTGSSSAGTGTATVTAVPQMMPGMATATTCSGTVAFRYATYTNTTRSIRGRRSTSSQFLVDNINLINRTSTPPAGGMPNTMPAAMGGQMPGMPQMPGQMPGMPTMPTNMGGAGGTRQALTAGMAVPTQVGMIISGNLQAGDTALANGAVADDYAIQLTAGVPVTIVTRGGPSASTPGMNLDVYTILMQNGVEVTHDDDSAGSLNSRILYTPMSTGIYTIRVTTYSSGLNPGMYTLQTWPGLNPSAM